MEDMFLKNKQKESTCKWEEQCRLLDDVKTKQRVFYCLKAISSSVKNYHWKKKATFEIHPYIDHWSEMNVDLVFSSPFYRITDLRDECARKKRNKEMKMPFAIPFMYYHKSASHIKKQSLMADGNSVDFEALPRHEFSYSFALFLYKEMQFFDDFHLEGIDENLIYCFIASLISSSLRKDISGIKVPEDLDFESYIETICSRAEKHDVEISSKLSYFDTYKELDNLFNSDIDSDDTCVNADVFDLESFRLFGNTIAICQAAFYQNKVSLFPALAIKDFFHIFEKLPHKKEISDATLVKNYCSLSKLYLNRVLEFVSSFLDKNKLSKVYESDEKKKFFIKQSVEINYLFHLIDNVFPAFAPIPFTMNDGKIEIKMLSESPTYAKTFFGAAKKNTRYINLLAAESINTIIEITDSGYRLKRPKKDKENFFDGYVFSDNYYNTTTQKKRVIKKTFQSENESLPYFPDSMLRFDISYKQGKALFAFLVLLSFLSLPPIFLKADLLSYLVGGTIPLISLMITSFSLGRWNLSLTLVKPFKISFAIIAAVIFIKITMIVLGKNCVWIKDTFSWAYDFGSRYFYFDI